MKSKNSLKKPTKKWLKEHGKKMAEWIENNQFQPEKISSSTHSFYSELLEHSGNPDP